MYAIILSACLTNQPAVCRDYKISIDAAIDQMHCMMDAPPYFAEWTAKHPGWQIKRWRCGATSEDDI